MNKSPAFQFYPKDYQSDEAVRLMNHEERGIYVDLLCAEWLETSIPSDTTLLARLIGITPGKMVKAWELMGPKFSPHPSENGRLIHPRLEEERVKQAEWREKSSKGGLKSAELRRQALEKGG